MFSPVLIVQLCYAIPSLLLYLLVLLVLFYHSCFDTVGYIILKCCCILQVLVYLSVVALVRIQSYPEFIPFFQEFYSRHQWTAKFLWVFFADFHFLYISIVFSGIERIIYLANPIIPEQKIRHLILPFFLCLTPVSFVLSVYIPCVMPYIITISSGGAFNYRFRDENLVAALQFVYSLIYFSFLLGIILLSIVMLTTVKKATKRNRKLFAVALIITIFQSVYPTLQFLSATATLFGIREKWRIHVTLPYAWDLACLCTPWIHAFLNPTIRSKIIGIVRNDEEKALRAYLPANPRRHMLF